MNDKTLNGKIAAPDSTWATAKFRIVPEAKGVKAPDTQQALFELHSRQTFPCKLISCKNLQSPSSGWETVNDHLKIYL